MWARTAVSLRKRKRFIVYLVILLTTGLENLTLPPFTLQGNIQQAFKSDSQTASWLLSGYIHILGSSIMVSSKISDIIGPHNTYIGNLASNSDISLVCACTPHTSVSEPILFRTIR